MAFVNFSENNNIYILRLLLYVADVSSASEQPEAL
jgi:hypothetical protein